MNVSYAEPRPEWTDTGSLTPNDMGNAEVFGDDALTIEWMSYRDAFPVFWVKRAGYVGTQSPTEAPSVAYDKWMAMPHGSGIILYGLLDTQLDAQLSAQLKRDDTSFTEPTEPEQLVEALMDLYGIEPEDVLDGEPMPTGDTLRLAERVLRTLYRRWQVSYGVYPELHGNIAIDAPTSHGTKLVVLCKSDGTAQCLAYTGDFYLSRKYDDLSKIPDRFISDMMKELLRREGR